MIKHTGEKNVPIFFTHLPKIFPILLFHVLSYAYRSLLCFCNYSIDSFFLYNFPISGFTCLSEERLMEVTEANFFVPPVLPFHKLSTWEFEGAPLINSKNKGKISFSLAPSFQLCLMTLKVQVRVLVTQSCPTLCDPMDCSLPGSSVHGIRQARIQEWVAMSYLICYD